MRLDEFFRQDLIGVPMTALVQSIEGLAVRLGITASRFFSLAAFAGKVRLVLRVEDIPLSATAFILGKLLA